MKLDHIPLEQLKLSPLNVRTKGGKDVADLLPSIRRLGILQPLLVRPNCEGFEIVAGQRRFHALNKLAQEDAVEPVPCIVMEAGDDATAIEASLTENIAHLPMDEIDQYKAFQSMRDQGLDVGEIAARFGVTERLVNQRLAIAGIIEPILNAYRREQVGPDTLQILTMATPRQQKAWWKLFKDGDAYAPHGRSLKEWLFGGSQVPVSNALFAEADYPGTILSDLFGDERYFADAASFWPLQNAAIALAKETYLASGWTEVVVLDIGQHFAKWQHEKVGKSRGGKVFVEITHDGEVAFHEGWLSMKEARRKAKAGEDGTENEAVATSRPELTKAVQNYLGLHKHAAVRTELLAAPSIALRLAVAHIIAGSSLWSVTPDALRPDNNAIGENVAAAEANKGFAEERDRIAGLLGIAFTEDEERPTITGGGYRSERPSLGEAFASVMQMEDAAVLRVLTYLMAETLEPHSGTVEALGALLSTDMRNWWTPDQIFLELMRDKEALNAMVREIASDATADAHTSSTAKVQKKIIVDCLSGEREAQVKDWLPRYMRFPASGYTGRFVGNVVETEPDAVPIESEGDDTE
jgi:ParB family transcriptional regulator, chromosome partitioning protein